MNELQQAYVKIIVALSNIPEIWEFGGDTLYGLSNYIAKFSLASDEYWVSQRGFEELERQGLSLSPLRRGHVSKKLCTFEHAVPVSIIRQLIKGSSQTEEYISKILKETNCIVIITQEENKILSKQYRQHMPKNWVLGDGSPFARHEECGIKILGRIQMTGAIIR